MAEITRILEAIDEGDSHAAEELLPLVYDELRQLATQKLSHEKPGQTLQATALVHEAYVRLVGSDDQQWDRSSQEVALTVVMGPGSGTKHVAISAVPKRDA